MKRDNINYLVVGMFVLIVIGTFFTFMHFVTGRTGPAEEYFVRYKNVSGLKFGTGVFYEGYRVGQIEKIVPAAAPTGMEYVLTLSIARDWDIPEDSVAHIMSSGLISAVQIEIVEGKSTNNIEPGGEIVGREQQNLFAVLGEVAAEFGTLSQEGVLPVLKNLDDRINQIGPLVETFDQRVNQDLIGDVQSLIAKLDSSATQLEQIMGSENQQQIENFLGHIDDVALNLGDLITRIEETRRQMGETLLALKNLASENDEKLANTIGNTNHAMEQMLDALETVNEHIGTIMYNVEGSTRQLHEFSQAVRDNPARLIRGTEPHDEAN